MSLFLYCAGQLAQLGRYAALRKDAKHKKIVIVKVCLKRPIYLYYSYSLKFTCKHLKNFFRCSIYLSVNSAKCSENAFSFDVNAAPLKCQDAYLDALVFRLSGRLFKMFLLYHSSLLPVSIIPGICFGHRNQNSSTLASFPSLSTGHKLSY